MTNNFFFLLPLVAILFSCKRIEEPYLTVGKTKLAFTAQVNSEDVTCSSNAKIEVKSSQPLWCTATVTADGRSIIVRAERNETLGVEREAFVDVTAGKATPVRIEVKQSANPVPEAYFEVLSETEQHFSSYASERLLAVHTNISFTAKSSERWCTTEIKNNPSDYKLAINVARNDDETERIAVVTVVAEGFSPVEINVVQQKASYVRIVKEGSNFCLYIGGVKTFLKGVRGGDASIAALGANATTEWWTEWFTYPASIDILKNILSSYKKNNLYTLFGFALSQNMADYSSETYKQSKKEEVRAYVQELKDDYPNIFMWALGNELDSPGFPDTPALWQFINELAIMIKSIDNSRLVGTVLNWGYGLNNVAQYCPALDVVGINAYNGIKDVEARVGASDWKGAYIITEYGPDGYWEVPKTSWDAPLEPTGEEKRVMYETRYNNYIKNKPRCLGGYAFNWTQYYEYTPTWFCMHVENGIAGLPLKGESTPVVEAIERIYKGEPEQTAPKVTDIYINNISPANSIKINSGTTFTGKVDATDREQSTLTYVWEILEDVMILSGSSRIRIGNVQTTSVNTVTFPAITTKGNYRLYVYVLDGTGRVGTANAPFQVQ